MITFNPERCAFHINFINDKIACLYKTIKQLTKIIDLKRAGAASLNGNGSYNCHASIERCFKLGAAYDIVSNDMPIFEESHSTVLQFITATNKNIQDAEAYLGMLYNRLKQLSEEEVSERLSFMQQQHFGKEQVEITADCGVVNKSGDEFSQIFDARDRDFSRGCYLKAVALDEVSFVNVIKIAKWVQMMLQLEGDDRFSTLVWQNEQSTMSSFVIVNYPCSILVKGCMDMHSASHMSGVTIKSIRGDLGYMTLGEIARAGSTASSTFIRDL